MQPFFALELASVAEVSGIAEARNDVFVLVQSLIDRCTPDGSLVFREGLLDVLDALWSSQILDMNPHLGMLLVGIFAIGTHESIAGVVEDIEEYLKR